MDVRNAPYCPSNNDTGIGFGNDYQWPDQCVVKTQRLKNIWLPTLFAGHVNGRNVNCLLNTGLQLPIHVTIYQSKPLYFKFIYWNATEKKIMALKFNRIIDKKHNLMNMIKAYLTHKHRTQSMPNIYTWLTSLTMILVLVTCS